MTCHRRDDTENHSIKMSEKMITLYYYTFRLKRRAGDEIDLFEYYICLIFTYQLGRHTIKETSLFL